MPRLPTMRVIGSQAISTRPSPVPARSVVVIDALPYQLGRKPVVTSRPVLPHFGSLSAVLAGTFRRERMTEPYMPLAAVDTLLPGGSSMNGVNLSGTPGRVQPMQMPPTLGQPPPPLSQPRLGTLHFTTGPQQPILTRHLGDPYSVAKSPCS